MSMAPVAAMISGNALSIGAMKSKIQSIASPGPAMNPSSDIDLFTTTLPFPVLVSRMCSSEGPSRGSSQAAVMTLRGTRVSSAIEATCQTSRSTPVTHEPRLNER
jgi:hypothetical protein